MIEHCCLQLGQQATQEANLVSISVQTEEQPHVKRATPRENTCCTSVLGEILFNGYCGQLIRSTVYRREEMQCNLFWTLCCISEVPLPLRVSQSEVNLGLRFLLESRGNCNDSSSCVISGASVCRAV